MPDLIETFAYLPDAGLVRIDMHLARMARSARALGFVFNAARADEILTRISGNNAKRCRLTLSPTGEFDMTIADLPKTAPLWKVAISPTILRSDDPWLRHKSTHRAIYDQARSDLPEGVDEWIFLNEQGHVTEGTITNVVVHLHDGPRITPPLADGVLPGVYRAHLIDTGAAVEQSMTPGELHRAQAIFMVNSLRGEIPAQLADGHH